MQMLYGSSKHRLPTRGKYSTEPTESSIMIDGRVSWYSLLRNAGL